MSNTPISKKVKRLHIPFNIINCRKTDYKCSSVHLNVVESWTVQEEAQQMIEIMND